MAATLNGMYSSAPDTPSPVYPDRLIRPLPKRPLRTRLSSDAADSILYPPAPPATQLFYGACADSGEVVNDAKVYVQQSEGHDHSPERDHLPYDNGVDVESGDEDGPVVVHRSAGFRGSPLSPSAVNSQPQPHPANGEGTPIKSSAGPDGYDAFENTNNKKKRKIPTPGNLGSHSTLSPEFSTMGLTSSAPSTGPPGDGSHVSTFYGTGSPASPVGHGMSGPGRGRLGRHAHRNSTGRGSVSHPNPVAWSQGRGPARRDGLSSPGSTGEYTGSDQGIISAAIANAAASAFPAPPPGSKAVSMLEQQATTPTKTQFTFTCESDSSKGMALQPQSPYAATHRSPGSIAAQNQRRFSTQATQTSPNTASQMSQQPGHPTSATGGEPNNTGRKKKRSPGTIYALAARQRKIQQQYTNLHHPPNLEDIWICEFCEYESIFGHPPEALIRQYEIKDRKERKRLAEKKRLLEKAKMKGRKNKKAPKGATKHTASHQGCCDGSHDRASADHSSLGGGPGQHDEDYDYDDEPVGPPPTAPPTGTFKTPLPPGNHPKTPASASGIKGAADGSTNRPP